MTEDERRFLGLSADGKKIAEVIRAKKRVLTRLFIEVLGVPDEQAHIDAEMKKLAAEGKGNAFDVKVAEILQQQDLALVHY